MKSRTRISMAANLLLVGLVVAAATASGPAEEAVISESNDPIPVVDPEAEPTLNENFLSSPSDPQVLPVDDEDPLRFASTSCSSDGVCEWGCHPDPDPDCLCVPNIDCGIDSDCPPEGWCNQDCGVCQCDG